MGMRRGSRRVVACSAAATGATIASKVGVVLTEGSAAGASDTCTGGAASATTRSLSLGSSHDAKRKQYAAPAAVSASVLLIAYLTIAVGIVCTNPDKHAFFYLF